MTIETATYKFPSPEDSESPNGPAQIKALADKLEAAKWLSQSLKPTVGVKATNVTTALGGSYADIPNTTLEITPAVSSNLVVVLAPWLLISGFSTGWAIVSLDGVDQERAAVLSGAGGSNSGTPTQVMILALTAAKHTIKLRAKKEGAESGSIGVGSGYLYALFAS